MSVIAWDGARLAADKRGVNGTLINTLTKVFHLGDSLAAYAGGADFGEEVLAWFKAGHDPATFPASQRDKNDFAQLLVVWPDGSLWTYERTPFPIHWPPQLFAIGSGRDFALAAMHLGKTAPEAVEVACVFDSVGAGSNMLSFGRLQNADGFASALA